MAVCYFTMVESAKNSRGDVSPAGNYYIEGMDGFTSAEEVFKVALPHRHKVKVASMWLQYSNKEVRCLLTGKDLEGEQLSEFAQAKLTATKWGAVSDFPYGSARFLKNGSFSKKTFG